MRRGAAAPVALHGVGGRGGDGGTCTSPSHDTHQTLRPPHPLNTRVSPNSPWLPPPGSGDPTCLPPTPQDTCIPIHTVVTTPSRAGDTPQDPPQRASWGRVGFFHSLFRILFICYKHTIF